MSKLKESAKKSVELKGSKYAEGREYIEIASIVFRNEPIAIEGCDLYTKTNKETGELRDQCYLLFTLDGTKYYINTGAKKLVAIVQDWLTLMEGNMEQLNKDLQQEPVSMKIISGKMSDGSKYYTAEIMD